MDNSEIRLRIVEAVIPIASRVEINSAEKMVEKCKELEAYVMGPVGKNPAPRRTPKSKTANEGNK